MQKSVRLRVTRVLLAALAICLLLPLILSKYALSVTYYELPLHNGSTATDAIGASNGSIATTASNGSIATTAANGSIATTAANGSNALNASNGSADVDVANATDAAIASDAPVAPTASTASTAVSGIRIVQLTDLHNSRFGPSNAWLVSKVAAQHPDLIFLTGDLLNADEDRTDIAVKLIEKLSQIAPVYISYGNHEVEYEEKYGMDLKPLYESAGGTVLERSYVDVTVRSVPLRIGGIYGYCLRPDLVASGEANPQEVQFLEEFQDTDREMMLLCHMPAAWLLWGSLEAYDIDTVWSGHVHGGQVILPGIGGLYGPDFGWFPGRLQGLYFSEDGSKTLILSRGLGNRDMIPRINNIPEIVVVDLALTS